MCGEGKRKIGWEKGLAREIFEYVIDISSENPTPLLEL